MDSSLKHKTIVGMIWASIEKFGVMGVSFIANIVLARLLSPSDFGAIGMLAIFVTISSTFIDGGFGSALIQKKQPTQADYSTIFYVNILISILLYGILFICSPLIAEFYHMEILDGVMKVLGLILILNGLSIIQANRLRKQLEFKKLSVIYIISITVSVIVAIVMAFHGLGVWSLVWMQIINSGVCSLLLWIAGHWKPSWCFSKESLRQLFGFGSFLLVSNLINTACNNIQGLLIGRMFTPAMMGYYSQARKLEEIPSTSISSIIDKVSYPVMSLHQNNPVQLVAIVRKFISLLAFITVPVMSMLIILGKPLIIFLFSDKWLPCVPYFQILCVAGIAVSLQNINYFAVAAIGKSRDLFKWTIIKRSVGLVFVIGGCFWGIYGLLIGTTLCAWTVYYCNAYLVGHYLNYSLKDQFLDLLPILIISTTSLLIALIPIIFINDSTPFIIIASILFLAIYIGASYMTKIKAWTDFIKIITSIKSK